MTGNGTEYDETATEVTPSDPRRATRRRILKITAVSAGIIALGAFGVSQVMTGPTNPLTLRDQRNEDNIRSFFEKTHARQGIAGLQAYLATASEGNVSNYIAWVCETGKTPLYADVVTFTADPRPRIRVLAIAQLMGVAPADLSAHKGALKAVLQTAGYDPELAPLLAQLIGTIP